MNIAIHVYDYCPFFSRIIRAFLIEEQKIVTGMLASKAQSKK